MGNDPYLLGRVAYLLPSNPDIRAQAVPSGELLSPAPPGADSIGAWRSDYLKTRSGRPRYRAVGATGDMWHPMRSAATAEGTGANLSK